jgi:iron complex transport system ATP-binding protein
MTSHFPDHAFLCCTKVVLMQKNNIFTIGNVDEVVTEANLKLAYGANVKITSVTGNEGEIVKSCIPMINKSYC